MQLMGRTQGKARGWFRWRSRSCVPAGTSLAARQGLYRLVRYRDDVCIVCALRTAPLPVRVRGLCRAQPRRQALSIRPDGTRTRDN